MHRASVARAPPRYVKGSGSVLQVLAACEPRQRFTASDRRTGGGTEPGRTLVQISQFRSASSAASASAKSRGGMRERNARGLSSLSGQVFGTALNEVESRRCEKAFQSGVAAASY